MNLISGVQTSKTPTSTEWLGPGQHSDAHLDLEQTVAEHAGRHQFAALFDTSGNLVPAKRMRTKTGFAWALLDTTDGHLKTTGWVREPRAGSQSVRRRKLAQRGYSIGVVLAPAKVRFDRPSTGFNGARGIQQYVVRTDGGFSPDVEVMTTGL